MINKIILLLFIFLVNIYKILSQGNKIISIPFTLKYTKFDNHYNSTSFFNEYFKKEIILKFNIGTPLQEIKILVDQNSYCFNFKKDSSDIYFTDNYRYSPRQSSTFYKTKNPVIYDLFYEVSADKFNFKEKDFYELEFLIENYTKLSNITYLPVLGLDFPIFYTGIFCPNLIYNLKQEKIINKLTWSLEYHNQFEGRFVIGDELSVYDPIKFPNSNYSSIYFNSNSKFTLIFDSIYSEDRWYNSKMNNNNTFFNLTEAFLNINFGLIIGTEQYKKYIDEKFFNALISRSICKIDIINYSSFEHNNKKFNNEYYVYNCYDKFFTGNINARHPSINYYNYFPNLIFVSKQLESKFELNNKNLFYHISDRYYFSIIFKKNINLNDKDIWYLGEPFYKKYPFTINYDAKRIGFYLEKDKNIIINERKNINGDANNKSNENKVKNKNKTKKFILEIIIFITFVSLAYFLGVTVRERRKKRANELKDDNYEYLSEKDKNINKICDDSNKHKFIELNNSLNI